MYMITLLNYLCLICIVKEQIFPTHSPLSLKQYCERAVSQYIDTKNAIQILVFAERINCVELAAFAIHFIRMNLDGIMVLSKPSDLNLLLNDLYNIAHKLYPTREGYPIRVRTDSDVHHRRFSEDIITNSKIRSCSFEDTCNIERTRGKVIDTYAGGLKLVKAIKKKLSSIQDIEDLSKKGSGLLPDQLEKLSRKNGLLAELKRLEPVLKRMEDEAAVLRLAELRRTSAVGDALSACSGEGTTDVTTTTSTPTVHTNTPTTVNRSTPTVNTSTTVTKKNKGVHAAAPCVSIPSTPPSFSDWGNSKSVGSRHVTTSMPLLGQPSDAMSSLSSPSVGTTTDAMLSTNSVKVSKPVWSTPKKLATASITINTPSSAEFKSPQSIDKSSKSNRSSPDTPTSTSANAIVVESTSGVSLADYMITPTSMSNKPVEKQGEKQVSTSKSPWTAPGSGDKKISLSLIQSEEEKVRMNGNIGALQGNDNPWFIERRYRTPSFDVIIESQIRENEGMHFPTFTCSYVFF